MMKVISAAVVLLAGFVATASAGEISKSALGSMGFSSMQKMSDNDGLAVRGKGTSASVWGSGTANFWSRSGNATETTGYQASSQHKRSSSTALGANIALAGKVSGSDSGFRFTVIGAAGGSFASAH